jgi:hypothetical protein
MKRLTCRRCDPQAWSADLRWLRRQPPRVRAAPARLAADRRCRRRGRGGSRRWGGQGGDVGARTGIEWTDATWNPIRGCSRVSEGCRCCYAEKVAARFAGPGQPYAGLARRTADGEARWTGEVRLIEEALTLPLRWTRPRRIFVNSMSDLFAGLSGMARSDLRGDAARPTTYVPGPHQASGANARLPCGAHVGAPPDRGEPRRRWWPARARGG